jgi:hypothetical protein
MKVYSEYGNIFRDLFPKITLSGDVATIMQLLKSDAKLARKERENPEKFWKNAIKVLYPEYIHKLKNRNVKDYKKAILWITYSHNKILKFMKIKKLDNDTVSHNGKALKLVDFVRYDLGTPSGCLLDVSFTRYNDPHKFKEPTFREVKSFCQSFFINEDEQKFFGFYWGPTVHKYLIDLLATDHTEKYAYKSDEDSDSDDREYRKSINIQFDRDYRYFKEFGYTNFNQVPYPTKDEKIYLGNDIFKVY